MRGKMCASSWERQHRVGSLFRIQSSKSILNVWVSAVQQHSVSISMKDVTLSGKGAKIANT